MPDALKVPRSGSVPHSPGEVSGAETSALLMRISPEMKAQHFTGGRLQTFSGARSSYAKHFLVGQYCLNPLLVLSITEGLDSLLVQIHAAVEPHIALA